MEYFAYRLCNKKPNHPRFFLFRRKKLLTPSAWWYYVKKSVKHLLRVAYYQELTVVVASFTKVVHHLLLLPELLHFYDKLCHHQSFHCMRLTFDLSLSNFQITLLSISFFFHSIAISREKNMIKSSPARINLALFSFNSARIDNFLCTSEFRNFFSIN